MQTAPPSARPLSARALRAKESPISWLMARALEVPGIISLAAGFVDGEGLPAAELARLCAGLLGDPQSARSVLNYGTTAGSPRLRTALAARLAAQGLPAASPADLMITNGGQQSLFTIADAVLDPGDIVLVEDPTYFVHLDVLRAAGARVVGVATDDDGLVPEALEERLAGLRRSGERARLRLVYIMSYYTNPKGVNLPAERRRRIAGILRAEMERGAPFLTVEDAAYRDLRLDGPEEPFLKAGDPGNDFIALVGTFSKAFSPGLRLGWCHVPPWLRERLIRLKGNQDFGSSNFAQELMARALEEGLYEEAATRFRRRYREKRDAMAAALRGTWPSGVHIIEPRGGLYAWAEIPGIDTGPGGAFFSRVVEEGVLYVPGEYCFCAEPQAPRPNNSMRLSFGVAPPDRIHEGITRMARVIGEFG